MIDGVCLNEERARRNKDRGHRERPRIRGETFEETFTFVQLLFSPFSVCMRAILGWITFRISARTFTRYVKVLYFHGRHSESLFTYSQGVPLQVFTTMDAREFTLVPYVSCTASSRGKNRSNGESVSLTEEQIRATRCLHLFKIKNQYTGCPTFSKKL